jgi:hypothetical protein
MKWAGAFNAIGKGARRRTVSPVIIEERKGRREKVSGFRDQNLEILKPGS